MKVVLLAALPVALLAAGCGSSKPVADGRHFGFIVRSSASTIAFDDAEFLSGPAAQKAAEADGAIDPGEPVSNDYYIRDENAKPATLRVAKDVRVTVVRCPTSCRDGFRSRLAQLEIGAEHPPYWVTTSGGEVTRIDEQYVP